MPQQSARVGAGRVVGLDAAAGDIAGAAVAVLGSPVYRDAASRLAATIEALQTACTARREVEEIALRRT